MCVCVCESMKHVFIHAYIRCNVCKCLSMERSAHIVTNLFAQVVCLLHLHTKSWNAMPVAAMPISEQALMESPSNGGAMIATILL